MVPLNFLFVLSSFCHCAASGQDTLYSNVNCSSQPGDSEVRDHLSGDNSQPPVIISSFTNKDGIKLRSYAIEVPNPKKHVIYIHGIRSHFRADFLRYNIEWFLKYLGDCKTEEAKVVGDLEKLHTYPALIKDKGRAVEESKFNPDKLNGKDAFSISPKFSYETSYAEVFHSHGFSIYGFDLQSHGLSGSKYEQKNHIENLDDYVYDVMQFISIVKRGKFHDHTEKWNEELIYGDDRLDDSDFFLVGSSMGANLIMKAAIYYHRHNRETHPKYKLGDYLVCLSSMLDIERNFEGIVRRLLWPLCLLSSYISPRYIHRWEDNSYKNLELSFRFSDKLYYSDWFTSSTIRNLRTATTTLKQEMKDYPKDLPTLFIHSIGDEHCSIEGPRKYMKEFFEDSTIVKLVEMENSTHLVSLPRYARFIKRAVKAWFNELPGAKDFF